MSHTALNTFSLVKVETETPAAPSSAHEPREIAGGIEAILFSTDRPVQPIRLAVALGLVADADEPPIQDQIHVEPVAPTSDPASPIQSLHAAADGGESIAGDAAAAAIAKPKRSRKKSTPATDAAASRARAIDLVRGAVAHLNQVYQESGRSFRVELLAGGFRVMTLPEFSGAIAAFQGARARTSLSPAALEALAIVSYKQPITRAKLEAIRGVACGEILRSLMERRLVTIVGRAEELGRPMLYGTTSRFLELFGLSSLKDLPTAEELRSKT